MKRDWNILTLYFQHVLNSRAKNLVWLLESLLYPFILMLFWQGALRSNPVLDGWTIDQIKSYYLFLIIAGVFLVHSVELVVAKTDIKNGELETYLLKPYSYMKFRFISEIPWRVIQFFYGIIAILLLAHFTNTNIAITTAPAELFLSVVIIFLAYVVSFFFKLLIGYIAFWIINIHGIIEFNDLAQLLFAGYVMPISLLPTYIYTIAHFTPYPYIIYYPIASITGALSLQGTLNVIAVQLIFIIVFFVSCKFLWQKGLRIFTGIGQ